jgi:hypothetical protein
VVGAVLQAGWLVTDKIALGGRYTILEYEAKASPPAAPRASA